MSREAGERKKSALRRMGRGKRGSKAGISRALAIFIGIYIPGYLAGTTESILTVLKLQQRCLLSHVTLSV